MIIKSIAVDGFKSLKNVDINNFDTVNLLYGFNNSGKSNLLKFLELIFRKKSFESYVSAVGSDMESYEKRELLQITDFWQGEIYDSPFYFFNDSWESGEAVTFAISLELDLEQLLGDTYFTKHKLYNKDAPNYLSIKGKFVPKSLDSFEMETNEIKIGEIILLLNDGRGSQNYFPSLGVQGDSNQLTSFLKQFNNLVTLIDSDRYFQSEKFSVKNDTELNSRNIKTWLLSLNLNHSSTTNFDDFKQFIGSFKLLDESLNDNKKNLPFSKKIELKKIKNDVEVLLGNENTILPVGNYGTGVQQIFYLLTKIFFTNSRVILIEEFELNLSKKYQLELIKFLSEYLKSKKKQLFFTSHSPYITEANGVINSHYLVEISSGGITSIVYETRGESGFKDWILS